ncbi:unnamed protein product, partial [Linum tenue]
ALCAFALLQQSLPCSHLCSLSPVRSVLSPPKAKKRRNATSSLRSVCSAGLLESNSLLCRSILVFLWPLQFQFQQATGCEIRVGELFNFLQPKFRFAPPTMTKIDALKPSAVKKKSNMKRLGGGSGGLSLETFASIKSTTNNYNPAIIKKKREFYKNAKYVGKFKKQMKQENRQTNPTPAVMEDGNDTGEGHAVVEKSEKTHDGSATGEGSRIVKSDGNKKKNKDKKNPYSLKQVYDWKREETEKANMERDAIRKAKEVERARAEAKRKAAKERMLKKTRHGQPVMKYRIEHLLQSLEGSKS